MKIVFVNIDKEKLTNISKNTRYVIIASDEKGLNDIKELDIKPIVILYNGAYVVDLENNNVIIEKPIDNCSFNKIIDYANTHDVNTSLYKRNKSLFEIKIMTNNYHRRLIIPRLFKDLIPNVNSISLDKEIFITNKSVSLNLAIEKVLEYLNVNSDIFELENIYADINDLGYYNKELNMKGYMLYES